MMRTRRGELSLRITSWQLLSKSLRGMPEKYHGLTSVETRYRKRYLDLAANDDSREVFIKRAKVIAAIRRFLDDRGFIEVETPVLQPLYGGALARPFVTHHNELERDLYLRIATELYLKRCIIGGIDRVYEIGKDFRNEGVSFKHNPEFTMLEFYEAYVDYKHVMDDRRADDVFAAESIGAIKVTFREPRDRPHAAVAAPDHARGHPRARPGIDIGADDARTVADLQATHQGGGARRQGPARPHLGHPGRRALQRVRSSPASSSRSSSPSTRSRPARSPRSARTTRASSSGSRASSPAWRRATPSASSTTPTTSASASCSTMQRPRGRRRGRAPARRGLPRGHGARHAADRRPRHGHRPSGHDPHRRAEHPRRHPLPGAARLEARRWASPLLMGTVSALAVVACAVFVSGPLLAEHWQAGGARAVCKLCASSAFVLFAVSLGATTTTYGRHVLGRASPELGGGRAVALGRRARVLRRARRLSPCSRRQHGRLLDRRPTRRWRSSRRSCASAPSV